MNALIVEDEELAVRNLTAILNEIGGITPIAFLESIAETVEWFAIHPQPDVVFMDIHLADGSAFEIFKLISIKCPVIFTTAYDEYALKAFKVNSIDYLLKPIDAIDVQNALNKLKELTKNNLATDDFQKIISLIRKETNYKTHFLVSQKGDKLIPLQVSDIAYFFIDTDSVKAVTHADKKLTMDFTLDELMNMLNPLEFFRANRQFIVSRRCIKDLDLWFNNRLSVNMKPTTNEQVIISKARVSEFKTWFGSA